MSMDINPLDRLRAARRYVVRGMVLAAFLSLAINILTLLVPIYMMQVHQRVLLSRNLYTLLWLSIFAFLALIIYGLFDYIRARIVFKIGDAITRLLDVPLLRAVISKSIGSNSSMSLNAMRDLAEIRNFMSGQLVMAPLDLLWVPFVVVILYLMHPFFAYTALASAAVLAGLGVVTELTARKPMLDANLASIKSLMQVNVAVRHAEVIEAMGMRGSFISRWRRSQRIALDELDAATNRIKALTSTAKSLRVMAQLAELGVGVFLVLSQQASITSMIASMLILTRALAPFEYMVEGWRHWVLVFGAYGRVRDMLEHSEHTRQSIDLPAPDGPLVVDRLTYVPPGAARPALRTVSFSLEPGEVLGVIGPSAAGKSTLARMLVGLWPPTNGGVYLDGHNTFQWDRENFGRYVGYLPQSVSLLEGTVADNITRLREADPADIISAAKKAGVHEMIGALPNGYETIIGDSLYTLSAGQRQRIGLARALFGNPRLLVLDEPNASLDADGDSALTTSIKAAKRDGIIVVLISHKPSVMTVVDKIMVLREGMIDKYGPRDEVLRDVAPRRPDANPTPVRVNSPIRAVLA